MTSFYAARLGWKKFTTWWNLLFCLALMAVPRVASATTVAPPDFAMLVNESDYIVHAVVKSVTSEWREKQGHRAIFTLVELEVIEVINGNPPQPLVLEMLGGRVGEEEMVVQGMPKFAVGQEDILFVRGNGRQFYPLTAAMHGRYPVVRGPEGRSHIARSNHAPLHETAEVSLPLDGEETTTVIRQEARATGDGLSPEDFVRQIRANVNPNYRRSRNAK